MNWEALGAVAEILGALGVIVTVAYLAAQIRQNSQLVASSLADSIRNAMNETSRIIASDIEAARIFRVGVLDRASLTEHEGYQFDGLVTMSLYGHQQAFVNGQIEDSAALEWLIALPGVQEWWRDYSLLLTSDFRKHVNRLLEKHAPAP